MLNQQDKNSNSISTNFNNKYKDSVIWGLIKDMIVKLFDDETDGKESFLKAVKFPKLKDFILKWLNGLRSENFVADGPLLNIRFKFMNFTNFVDFRKMLLILPN